MDLFHFCVSGGVHLSADRSLRSVAESLSVALGCASFTEDEPGTFDEFPSFSGHACGFRFALLGIPRPEDSDPDTLTDRFVLQVSGEFPNDGASDWCEVSAYFAEVIRHGSDLQILAFPADDAD